MPKLNLSQRYVYEGEFYGPGVVEFDEDEDREMTIHDSLEKREVKKAKLEKKQRKISLQENVHSIEAQVHPDKRGEVQQDEIERIASREDSDEPENPLEVDFDSEDEDKPKAGRRAKKSDEEEEPKKKKRDYSESSKIKLRKLAKKRDIPDAENMTKEELVSALEASDNP